MITTRHDLHAKIVIQALENGKSVFVEKPLSLNQDELNSILDSLNEDLYYSKMEAIKRNYNRAFNYPTFNNSLYDLYFKDIII